MENKKKTEKVSKKVKNVAEKAEKVKAMSDSANLALTEMRLQFDTIAEIQKEERIEYQKMHNESVKEIMDRHEKDIKHWKHICIGLILTLALFIGGLIGTVAYILTNFSFEYVDSFAQDVYVGGDGTSTINDGIHYNTD